ncbi:hypothetical protein [Candidatus Pelagibacter sp. HIMB1506]|uniref:hypothetical protein n=1 Tax=Candidatus Pelagibacter sp. HIMB1506 TaxID=3413337 RepID=UPI003F87E30F
MNNIQHIILKNKNINDVVIPKAYLEKNEYNNKLNYNQIMDKIAKKEKRKKKFVYVLSTISAIALIAASYS